METNTTIIQEQNTLIIKGISIVMEMLLTTAPGVIGEEYISSVNKFNNETIELYEKILNG